MFVKLNSNGQIVGKDANSLEVGYICLADFIDDVQAQIAINYEKLLSESYKSLLESNPDDIKKMCQEWAKQILMANPGGAYEKIFGTHIQEIEVLNEEITKFRRLLKEIKNT